MHAVDTCRMLLMYSMYFVVVTVLFELLAKHSLAALPCKRFVNKRSYTHKQFGRSLYTNNRDRKSNACHEMPVRYRSTKVIAHYFIKHIQKLIHVKSIARTQQPINGSQL